MKMLYAEAVGGEDSVEAVLEQSEGQAELNEKEQAFLETLLEGVHAHREELDAKIVAYSSNHSLSLISKVDLCILRIGLFELLYLEGTPVGATINEAVKLAKQFSAEKSAGFVNGALGAAAKANEV